MGSQTAASWVSAIGSAGSLLGFAAYVWIMLLNRKDEGEVRQEQQAQGVSAWLDEGARHDSDEDYVLCVHNGGVSPVFNVRMLFSLPSSEDQYSLELSIVPPQDTAVRSLPFDHHEVDRQELYSAPAVPELRFTDSHGGHWQRNSDGKLSRLDRRGPRIRPRARHEQPNRDDAAWEREHEQRSRATQTQHR